MHPVMSAASIAAAPTASQPELLGPVEATTRTPAASANPLAVTIRVTIESLTVTNLQACDGMGQRH